MSEERCKHGIPVDQHLPACADCLYPNYPVENENKYSRLERWKAWANGILQPRGTGASEADARQGIWEKLLTAEHLGRLRDAQAEEFWRTLGGEAKGGQYTHPALTKTRFNSVTVALAMLAAHYKDRYERERSAEEMNG